MKQGVYYLVKDFQYVLELDGLLLQFPQDPAICLHPEPDQSTLHPFILTFKLNFNITLISDPRHSQSLLSNLKQKMHVNGLHSDSLSLDTLRG
jgi:hypothetical protein